MRERKQTGYRLGVLGGGQLGRMMIEPALRWDVPIRFLASKGSPCSQASPYVQIGSPRDEEDVLHFGEESDIITIEMEDVPVKALFQLEERKKIVRPSPKAIQIVQDKWEQKQFLSKNHFPTATFFQIKSQDEAKKYSSLLPLVYKLRKSGYDGKGVQIFTKMEDFSFAQGKEGILEKKIDFDKELAVTVARDQKGNIAVYPPVEMVFDPDSNMMDFLVCPAEIPSDVQKKAVELSCDLISSLGIVGLLSIELFYTSSGKLLVNEVAPRPHNSAHHTIETCPSSQFEQLLRILLDLPLGETTHQGFSAVLNLFTRDDSSNTLVYKLPWVQKMMKQQSELTGTYLHLYGKKEPLPYRKMGHLTVCAESRDTLLQKVQSLKKVLGR